MKNKDTGETAALLLIVLIALICLVASNVKAQSTEEKIEWLTSYKTSPKKAYVRDVMNVDELADAINKAAEKYNIDVDYLLVIAWSESVFRNLIGDNGRSHGEMQVGKMGRRKCKCNMDTLYGRIDCGACWLNMGRKWCGSLDGGLQAYVSGSCVAKTTRAAWALQNKKTYVRKLKESNI